MELKEKMHRRTYWIPDSLDKQMSKYSNATKLSKSDVVRVAVYKYLWEHPLKIEVTK